MRGAARVVLVGVLVFGATARADELGDAKRALDALDYAGARTALAAARDSGRLGPSELVEVYRLTGTVAAALGDPAGATQAFARLLALAPGATLPAGTSPKITRPFEAARDQLARTRPLAVEHERIPSGPALALVIESDPFDMIAAARVAFTVDGGPEQQREVRRTGGVDRIEVALPRGQRIDARLVAIDDRGNRLVELGSRDVPIVLVIAPPAAARTESVARAKPPVADPGPRPIYLRWWVHAAVAAAALGGATYFGLAARSDAAELRALQRDSQRHEFTEAKAVADRARRGVLLANIGFGTAGVFAASAAVLYLLAPRATRERRVAAVPLRGGGAVVLGGRF